MNHLNLVWSSEFETGIEIIDEQHQRLFQYLAETERCIQDNDPQNVELVVHALVNYALSHNSFEESLMEKAKYPMFEAHARLHESFKQRANEYLNRLEQGTDPLKVAEQVRIYIGLWLISHVKQEDQDYVPYVKKIMHGGNRFTALVSRIFGKAA